MSILETTTPTELRKYIYRILQDMTKGRSPIRIIGKAGEKGAVLVSEDDWRAMEESLYLLSIPGMRESIREGMETPLDECTEDVDW